MKRARPILSLVTFVTASTCLISGQAGLAPGRKMFGLEEGARMKAFCPKPAEMVFSGFSGQDPFRRAAPRLPILSLPKLDGSTARLPFTPKARNAA
jgi:hypothetical protein